MHTNDEGRQRWNAPALHTNTDLLTNLTPSPGIRQNAVALRADPGVCPACATPLELARVAARRVRVLRSGEHIGRRAEFWTFTCPCGERRRVLWLVYPRPGRHP